MLTTESFCNSIWGLSYSSVLAKISKEDYLEFEIPKKNGMRKINYLKQDSELYDLQRKLLNRFLQQYPLPLCVKGFVMGENYNTFLQPHIGALHFLRIDIESFFPSIRKDIVGRELAHNFTFNTREDKKAIIDLISDIVTLNGVLPQGTCTSPMISNISMSRMDQRILKYCQVFGICYTRYADDLLFSSSDFDFSTKGWFLKKVKHILLSQNLKLNYSKIKYGYKEISLNGYVITCEGIHLSRKRLSDIRRVMRFTKQYFSLGTNFNHEEFLRELNLQSLRFRDVKKSPLDNIFQLVQYLCGYRAWLISLIDRDYANTSFQKDLCKTINRIEYLIIKLNNECK